MINLITAMDFAGQGFISILLIIYLNTFCTFGPQHLVVSVQIFGMKPAFLCT
jgi:hypothetical protein